MAKLQVIHTVTLKTISIKNNAYNTGVFPSTKSLPDEFHTRCSLGPTVTENRYVNARYRAYMNIKPYAMMACFNTSVPVAYHAPKVWTKGMTDKVIMIRRKYIPCAPDANFPQLHQQEGRNKNSMPSVISLIAFLQNICNECLHNPCS